MAHKSTLLCYQVHQAYPTIFHDMHERKRTGDNMDLPIHHIKDMITMVTKKLTWTRCFNPTQKLCDLLNQGSLYGSPVHTSSCGGAKEPKLWIQLPKVDV